jgi:hypothetical protein
MNERARPESVQTPAASLEDSAFFMPFSMNRHFKKAPRLLARAEGVHYITQDGRRIIDGTSGLPTPAPNRWTAHSSSRWATTACAARDTACA